VIVIEFPSLRDFARVMQPTGAFIDERRRLVFNVALSGSVAFIYRCRSDEEVRAARQAMDLVPARLTPLINPDAIAESEASVRELLKEAKQLLGAKLVKIEAGSDGIELYFDNGTVLELWFFGEWSWSIDREGDEDENPARGQHHIHRPGHVPRCELQERHRPAEEDGPRR